MFFKIMGLTNLSKETVFLDDLLDINHSLRSMFDFNQAEEDFKELEQITNNEACLKKIELAKDYFEMIKNRWNEFGKEYFDLIKRKSTEIGREYFEFMRKINDYLSEAYDLFIKKVNYSTT